MTKYSIRRLPPEENKRWAVFAIKANGDAVKMKAFWALEHAHLWLKGYVNANGN